MIQEILKSFFPQRILWLSNGHHEIFCKLRWWIGVTIGNRFVLVYFMFHGILIILGGINFCSKLIIFVGLTKEKNVRTKSILGSNESTKSPWLFILDDCNEHKVV